MRTMTDAEFEAEMRRLFGPAPAEFEPAAEERRQRLARMQSRGSEHTRRALAGLAFAAELWLAVRLVLWLAE